MQGLPRLDGNYEVVHAEEVARKQSRSRREKLRQIEQAARKKELDVQRYLAEIDRQIQLMQALVWPT